MTSPRTRAWSRLFEIAIALALLPALAGVACALWILGRLHGHSRLLFRQDRIGSGGRSVRILKFRTMWSADGKADGSRAYRIVRRTGLDELPQILHVLTGEMALVGPRPLLACDLRPPGEMPGPRLREAVRCRQSVRPGITGLSQVLVRHRGREGAAFWRMLDADVWYVRHRSFHLDASILLLTPLYALSGGALHFPGRALVPRSDRSPSRDRQDEGRGVGLRCSRGRTDRGMPRPPVSRTPGRRRRPIRSS